MNNTYRDICNNTSTATVVNEKSLSLKSQALMTSDTDTKSTSEKSPEIEISCIDDTWHRYEIHPRKITRSHTHWFDLYGKNPKRPSILTESSQSNALQRNPKRITAPIRNSHRNPTRIYLVFLWYPFGLGFQPQARAYIPKSSAWFCGSLTAGVA